MELTLDIFIFAGRNGVVSLYNKGICEINYDGYKFKTNDDNWYSSEFPIWDEIQIKYTGEVKIDEDEFYEIEISSSLMNFICFCVAKKDIDKVKDFCDKRNQRMHLERKSICSYIDENVLDIAENLINIAPEDVFLNERVVIWFHHKYYDLSDKSLYGDYYYNTLLDKDCYYCVYNDAELYKGKEKKEVENFNEALKKKIRETSELVNNFVEIIIEQRQLQSKDYIGKGIAWKVMQRKIVEYYAKKWEEEYEPVLDNTFAELYEIMIGQDVGKIEEKYIYEVAICDDINLEQSAEMLKYYLMSKKYNDDMILFEYIDYYDEIIKKIKEGLKSQDIKSKLMTKQKRRISKYTIDDVDLMTGAEFEEFVGLLFKKMGYSSQVTKQSGDQGLDVIAIKNGTKIGIQAKCYSNSVGNSAVQEAVAGKSFYNCDKVIVITNNYFTSAAEELAQSNGVILWNRDMLKEKIRELM